MVKVVNIRDKIGKREPEREPIYAKVKFDDRFLLTTKCKSTETELGRALYENRRTGDRSVEGVIKTANDFRIEFIAEEFLLEAISAKADYEAVAVPRIKIFDGSYQYDIKKDGSVYVCLPNNPNKPRGIMNVIDYLTQRKYKN